MAIDSVARVYYELVKANRKDSTKGRQLAQVPTSQRAEVEAMLAADLAAAAQQ